MKRKLGAWISTQTKSVHIDNDLLIHSRAARIGKRLMQASVVINTFAPAITVISIICLTTVSAMAQGPSGGTIFGGNDQTLGNGVRELVKWGRNLLFVLGIGGVGWGVFNFMTEKSCAKQIIGGGFSMAFGSIAALIYS